MRILRALLLVVFNLGVVVVGLQDTPPCSIEEIGQNAWQSEKYTFPDKIDDSHEGVFAEYKTVNVKEVVIKDFKYLTVTLADDILTFSVTEEFKNFEENGVETKIVENVYIKCLPVEESTGPEDKDLNEDELAEKEEVDNKEYHLELTQSINDLNTFEPKFTKDEYVFEYYHDLPIDDALTGAQRVSAEDKDMSTQTSSLTISFSIEKNDYFSISRGRADDFNKRLVHAVINTERYIKAPFNKTFIMTVVDSGKPEVKSSTAKLTVHLFAEQTLVFTKSVYNAELDGNNIKITDGPIAIVGGSDLNIKFDIASDDDIGGNFIIKQTIRSIEVILERSLNQTLVEERDYLYLTVSANKLGRIGHFAVMIKTNGKQSTTTEEPGTTPLSGGIISNLQAFENWILAGTALIWVSFTLLAIAFVIVIFSFKKYWQKKYNL